MKIKKQLPPIYQQIIEAGLKPHDGVIYTYGDTIYNPNNLDIPEHLIKHEETHSIQQGSKPDEWWSRYLDDQYFRIEQEAEAYSNQYKFICQNVLDRNKRNLYLHHFALSLSSQLYGNVITYQSAINMIKNK